MTVGDTGSPRHRFGGVLDALFGEAWNLERRRRRRLFLVVLLCCAAAAAIALAFSSGGSGPINGTAAGSARAAVASRTLPLSTDYTGLSLVHGKLVLIDYGKSAARASNAGTCRTALVNPQSLRLTSVAHGPCDDPVLFHRKVMEIDEWNRVAQIQVRIATVNPRSRPGFTLGPPLASYQQCSDCWDASIYGPRALWVYAPIATPRGYKGGGELFRVSERTGKVLQRWSMPSMTRPLLAVDADGLWITNSIDGGGPGILYHVSSRASAPEAVVKFSTTKNPGLPAQFLIAAGHTVWFETYLAERRSVPRLWRLSGTKLTVRDKPVRGGADCTDSGEGSSTVLGTASTGFYCVALAGWQADQAPTKEKVFRILPGRREQQYLATVTPPPGTYDVGVAAALDNAYYFLDPPTLTATKTNAGRLFRITAH